MLYRGLVKQHDVGASLDEIQHQYQVPLPWEALIVSIANVYASTRPVPSDDLVAGLIKAYDPTYMQNPLAEASAFAAISTLLDIVAEAGRATCDSNDLHYLFGGDLVAAQLVLDSSMQLLMTTVGQVFAPDVTKRVVDGY